MDSDLLVAATRDAVLFVTRDCDVLGDDGCAVRLPLAASGGMIGIAVSAGHVAAVTADRREVVVWRHGAREPIARVPVMRETRHRVGDVAFG